MRRTANWLLAGAMLLALAALVIALSQSGADEEVPDTIGYVQAAHQLARGEGLAFQDPHNQVDRRYYMLYAFKVVRPAEPNRYFGLLPGVSVLAAAVERLTGNPAMVQILTPIAAALLILITFAFGRALADAWAGLWASLVLFCAPTFLRFSAALWSEIPSTVCLYLGLALVVLAFKRAHDDGPAGALGLGGGLIAGAAFFMRFSNFTVIPAILGLIGVMGGRAAYRQRRSLLVMGALVIACLALLGFNALYYGGPLDTGYSPRHGWYNQPAFSLSYAFGRSFVNGYSIPQMGREILNALGAGLVLALVGIFVKPRRVGWWLAGTSVVLLLPYMFYAFAPEGLNARFVIPALPALAVLAGRGIAAIGRSLPSLRVRYFWGLILTLVLLGRVPQSVVTLQVTRASSLATIEQVVQLMRPTEPNAVILSYAFNDVIAVYARRSAMTYRQMVPYDPSTGTYQYQQIENILAAEIDRLLAEGTPVYYILDGNPPLYNSDRLLQQHFKLTPISDTSPVYRVEPKAQAGGLKS